MATRGVNKVILIGHLGKDPEVRYFPSGDAVANFNLATSEAWKDRNTGELQERTEWHRVAIFGKLAEVAKQYLRKGSKVYIEGKLRTRKWQGQDGQDRYTTEVIVDISGTMQLLDSRSGGAGETETSTATDYAAPPPSFSTPAPAAAGHVPFDPYPPAPASVPPASPPPARQPTISETQPFDDDIPF